MAVQPSTTAFHELMRMYRTGEYTSQDLEGRKDEQSILQVYYWRALGGKLPQRLPDELNWADMNANAKEKCRHSTHRHRPQGKESARAAEATLR